MLKSNYNLKDKILEEYVILSKYIIFNYNTT